MICYYILRDTSHDMVVLCATLEKFDTDMHGAWLGEFYHIGSGVSISSLIVEPNDQLHRISKKLYTKLLKVYKQ